MLIRYTLTAILALALPVCVVTASAGSLSNADKQFLNVAARADMTGAHEGQMAQEQGSRSDVKEFAKSIVQDHTQSYGRLSQIAAKEGVTIPNGINTAKVPAIVQLARLKGASFDRQFTRDEVADCRHALAIFKQEAKLGKDPEVKSYANEMIPVLEKHLHLAEECAKAPKRS